MKPKEFDELIRQKFDRGDFEYNPANWDRLVDELDGRSKKNRMIMWWWAPLVGVAASVVLAMGIQILMRPATNRNELAQSAPKASIHTSANETVLAQVTTTEAAPAQTAATDARHTATHSKKQTKTTAAVKESFAINLDAALSGSGKAKATPFNFNSAVAKAQPKDKKKQPVAEGIVATFKPEAEAKKPAKFFIILSGGVNRGSQSNGYMAGATIRKMINDKVFIESDVAFASSSNSQATEYRDLSVPSTASKTGPIARATTSESSKVTTAAEPAGVIRSKDISYNLSYAQITPSLGLKIMKHMSVAAGPDFEQVLVDNRPATSTVDRDNLQIAPMFDIGFMGKTEYSFNKWVKAGVSYRKGINNVITPTNRYIDRDYLQFQVKCAIFNK